MGGYVYVSLIAGTLLRMAVKIWAYTGLAIFFSFLVYFTYGGIFAFVILIFSLLGLLYHLQDKLVFYPEFPSHSRVYIPNPAKYCVRYESIRFSTADNVSLHLYFISQQIFHVRKSSPTIVFFHGNAGNIGHRLQNCYGLYRDLHCNILLVEYRGYGLSEGTPSEKGLYLDAKASLDYLSSRHDIDHSKIIIFGRSLGGAIAIDLCTREEYAEKIWCLIVENTFTSIPDIAKVALKWRKKTIGLIRYVPLFFFKNKFLSVHKVQSLKVPTLFISGMADTLVPPYMMLELHNKCASSKKLLVQIPDGTHDETWKVPGYYGFISEFLDYCSTNSTRVKDEKEEIGMV